MKKKINFQLMAIATVAIFATVFLISAVFYELYRDQIIEDLRAYSGLMSDEVFLNKAKEGTFTDTTQFRMTLIGEDGSVLFDSEADNSSMDNHSGRPEVLEAREEGEGISVRHSDTMRRSTFYYARLLEDGSVLRVSREAGSIWSIFYRAMPVIALIVVVLIILCMIMSHFLTKRLMAPIEQLAKSLDKTDEIAAYEELQPFINMIQTQHEDIMKNALIRQEFTANVSHELKTPLTSISGYAEIMRDGLVKPADVPKFSERIYKEAQRMLTLINDIIQLSRLDEGHLEQQEEAVDLFELSHDIVGRLSSKADDCGVHVELTGESCIVTGVKRLLDEMIYNITENAIKYNHAGGRVDLWVGKQMDTPKVIVTDTGIGIAKDEQERVFERFYRVDKSRSKETGGTGLGLSIVKHGAELSHAKIKVTSQLGRGTRMELIFEESKA